MGLRVDPSPFLLPLAPVMPAVLYLKSLMRYGFPHDNQQAATGGIGERRRTGLGKGGGGWDYEIILLPSDEE